MLFASILLKPKFDYTVLYKSHQIPDAKCFSSRISVVFTQSIKASCQFEYKDVVGAATTGEAPTTSEWSTISLPTKARIIFDVWTTTSRISN